MSFLSVADVPKAILPPTIFSRPPLPESEREPDSMAFILARESYLTGREEDCLKYLELYLRVEPEKAKIYIPDFAFEVIKRQVKALRTLPSVDSSFYIDQVKHALKSTLGKPYHVVIKEVWAKAQASYYRDLPPEARTVKIWDYANNQRLVAIVHRALTAETAFSVRRSVAASFTLSLFLLDFKGALEIAYIDTTLDLADLALSKTRDLVPRMITETRKLHTAIRSGEDRLLVSLAEACEENLKARHLDTETHAVETAKIAEYLARLTAQRLKPLEHVYKPIKLNRDRITNAVKLLEDLESSHTVWKSIAPLKDGTCKDKAAVEVEARCEHDEELRVSYHLSLANDHLDQARASYLRKNFFQHEIRLFDALDAVSHPLIVRKKRHVEFVNQLVTLLIGLGSFKKGSELQVKVVNRIREFDPELGRALELRINETIDPATKDCKVM